MSSKGQIWSMDLLPGLIVLSVMLLIFVLVWNGIILRWESSSMYRDMENAALFASESIMTTPGSPADWEVVSNANITAFGLASGRDELNDLKIDALLQNTTSYDLVRSRLGLERYNFAMNITDLNGNLVRPAYRNLTGDINDSVIITREGILDGNPVMVNIEVWR